MQNPNKNQRKIFGNPRKIFGNPSKTIRNPYKIQVPPNIWTQFKTAYLQGPHSYTANIFNVIFTVFKCVPISTVLSLYGLHLIAAPSTVE